MLERDLLSQYRIGNEYVDENAILDAAEKIYERRMIREGDCTSPSLVEKFLRAKIGHLEHEVFLAIFLDNRHRILATEILFRGTLDGASVYPREVVKRALHHNCAAVIFAHNHPSGVPEPSQADRAITADLKRALGTVDIRVIDHFVVSLQSSVSFAARGLL